MNDEAVDFLSRGDCTNSRLAHFSLGTGETFHSTFTNGAPRPVIDHP